MTEEPTFDPGNSVLVTAPSFHDEARTACLDRFVEATNAVLGVVYEETPESFLRPFRDARTMPRDIRIVSVGESLRSATNEATLPSGGNVVHTVPEGNDVDGVIDAVTSLLPDEDAVLIFHSLTAVLQRGSLPEAVTLVGRFADRLADTNAVGYFTLETVAHDRSTMSVFRTLCDTTVELVDDGAGWTILPLAERSPPDRSIDGVFDVLRSERRRHVLRHLLQAERWVSVTDLAEAVGRYETGADETTNNRRRLHTSLYQIHLPKLVDEGFVEYDETEGKVSLGPCAELAEPFLALAEE